MPQRPVQERDAVSAPSAYSEPVMRAARADEVDAIVALVNEAYAVSERGLFAHARTSREDTQLALAREALIVAESDGVIVATMQLDLGEEAHFGVLATALTAQGGGFGSKVVVEAERRAREAGHDRVLIECIGEVGLRTYYERRGYVLDSVDEEPLGSERSVAWGATRPWTMLHMRKALR